MASHFVVEDNKVIQLESSIPIAGKAQVLVAGGGTSGFAAAVAASRTGAETIILERNSCIGGMATAGLLGSFVGTNLPSGIFAEVIDRLEAQGAAVVGIRGLSEGIVSVSTYDPVELELLAFEMVQKAGVRLLLNTWVTDTIVSDSAIKGVVVENKSGRQAYLGDVVIDCTGDADIAARAGVEFELGREKDGFTQKASLVIRVSNVDVERLIETIRENPTQFHGGKRSVEGINKDVFMVPGFVNKVRDAKQRGELEPSIDLLNFKFVPGCAEHRTLIITATKMSGFNPTIAEELTQAEIQGRRQVRDLMSFMQREIPGFENAYLVSIASQIGIRDSRRIVGDYILTEEDIMEGRIPEDTIALSCEQGPTTKGWSRYDKDKPELYSSEREGVHWPLAVYGIPYRSLLPQKLDQLLVAGRCLSATWGAQGRSRSMPTCMGMGQAAGTAAALASMKNINPRKLDIKELRVKLNLQGLLVDQPSG